LSTRVLDEQGRRPEKHDLQGTPGTRVLVPEPLHRFRPADRLLHLVDHQDAALAPDRQPRRLPLLRDPLGPAQGRFVGADEADRDPHRPGDLLHEGGLADLPRPRHDVDEPPRLGQPPCQLDRIGPLE
jgi:hypothetical protein